VLAMAAPTRETIGIQSPVLSCPADILTVRDERRLKNIVAPGAAFCAQIG
jgi:hypothetical protein